jgi:hypothetical protein
LDSVNCCANSFGAAPGWDAVTGLGTPNFKVLANLVLAPATPYPAIDVSNTLFAEKLSSAKYVDYEDLEAASASSSSTSSTMSSVAVAGLVLGVVSCIIASIGLYVALSNNRDKRTHYEVVAGKETLLTGAN